MVCPNKVGRYSKAKINSVAKKKSGLFDVNAPRHLHVRYNIEVGLRSLFVCKNGSQICFYIRNLDVSVMVPPHFHDVDDNLSDHNVDEIFGLSKILTVIL